MVSVQVDSSPLMTHHACVRVLLCFHVRLVPYFVCWNTLWSKLFPISESGLTSFKHFFLALNLSFWSHIKYLTHIQDSATQVTVLTFISIALFTACFQMYCTCMSDCKRQPRHLNVSNTLRLTNVNLSYQPLYIVILFHCDSNHGKYGKHFRMIKFCCP